MNNIFSQKLRSDMNDLIWVYNLYLLAFVQRTLYIVLLLAGGVGVASSSPLQMPNSEVSYPGASANSAFVAMEPYVVNIQGVPTTISLQGASRKHDFSGSVPFVNPKTGKSDASSMQAWDSVFAASFTPTLSGDYDLWGNNLTNAGFPGRIDKRNLKGKAVTMVRYNAGDGLTWNRPRSKLNAFAIPPRTHVRWELEVAFGAADGVNDWVLTPTTKWIQDSSGNWVTSPGSCPVLFWQVKSANQNNPPLSANVDTDNLDPTKLMIYFSQKVGAATSPTEIARIHGIPRHTLIPIVIEAFLDERATVNGGKGLLQISVNGIMVLDKSGPTLSLGINQHSWSIDTYLWNQNFSYTNTRATFWKTARMIVFPVGAADTTPPSDPTNLVATASNPTKANLSWSASTDNVGIAGYRIYRDGIEIGTSAVASFTDTSVVGGTTYNYTLKAYDKSGNLSASSNTATVQTPKTINITSYYVGSITVTGATDNWTTNVLSTGTVYYGTNATNLGSSATFSVLSTNHAVKLTGLVRSTRYYYKIIAKDSGGATATSSVSSFLTTS